MDLADLESQIDDKTAAIVVNNPSNPCGSVYSQEHLIAILAIAEKHKVPVIADEIYRNMVFKGTTFHAMGELSDNVPTLSIGGMAKEFLVPGWRVGWILVHDRNSVLDEVPTNRCLHCCSVCGHKRLTAFRWSCCRFARACLG